MSTLEVNSIQPLSSGTTVTLGASGKTFNIPSGCTISNSGTATGFGDPNLAASCAFAAYIGSSQTNMPVNTLTTFPFDTEFFDLGNNFDTSTYTFTAPANGYYQFNTYIRLNNNDRSMTYVQFRLSTTTQTYERGIWDPNAYYNDVEYCNMVSSDLVYMNSGNTAKPQWYQGNGNANVDIPSGANQSMFSGFRVA